MRGIFFDADAAHTVAARLRDEGWDAVVLRERLAGEDDDEDHPWAVTTDAPSFVLDLLVDTHDGWLDDEQVDPGPRTGGTGGAGGTGGTVPLDLPTAPRRLKREP
ncbi:hypothetical protein GCM10009737_19880 [Nocardioides lentus]|uniref:DUF5615 domain-containing protein n=1 Tax=Nocardioides lentus TaxID=338077 RepID=A0ABP5AQK5_9ACTN